MYQRIGTAAYKANLENTEKLASYLNHPERTFKSVHVAGTNGKGSTSHMLASVLQEAGYAVGLYTSPHLKDFRERIKLNGTPISKSYVTSFVAKHKSFFETAQVSFFEMTVSLAFDYFRYKKVDIAIVEVGMGGRLDSTNIVTPEVSVITNIGLDHTQFLGTTLEQIASEKGGIIKQQVPVVIGETTVQTKSVFQEIAIAKQAPIYFAEAETYKQYPSDLQGEYQYLNRRTALKTLEILKQQGWNISENNISDGFKKVVTNTGLLGRWQVLQHKPKIICDTAHNEAGLRFVLRQLEREHFENLHIVLGLVNDKAIGTILPLFPKTATYYYCKPNIERGMEAEILKMETAAYGLNGAAFASVSEAFQAARQNTSINDLIFVGGSTFVVAEVV